MARAPRGGTYLLVDLETGQVMRVGQTRDLHRRELEHRRDPVLKRFDFQEDRRSDSYAARRGREQIIHDLFNPPLDRQAPISRRNPRRKKYLDAARKLDQGD